MVRKCTGYRFCVQGGILYFLLLLTTVVVSTVAPQLSIWLLLQKCPLNQAVLVRVKVKAGGACLDAVQLLMFVRAAVAKWQAASGQDQDTVCSTSHQEATGEPHLCSSV